MNTQYYAAALLLLGGCVQTNSMGNYSSISSVRYGDGQTLTRTEQTQWHNQQQQSPSWQAQLTPSGSSINIQAIPAPASVNIIVVPAQATCHRAPDINHDIIWPNQHPCRQ